MDKKLTDSEIKKALEWCEQFENNIVSMWKSEDKYILALKTMQTIKNVLNDYNRLQAENEVLEARIGVYETCNARKDEAIKHLEAENERLSAEICGQKEANLFLINDKENAINGAIKKFCDILKKRINNEPMVFFEQRHIVYDEIDNLLKEKVGE